MESLRSLLLATVLAAAVAAPPELPVGSFLVSSSRFSTRGSEQIVRVWVHAQNASETAVSTAAGKADMNPKVSPNGRSVCFYSNRGGTQDVWAADLRAATSIAPARLWDAASTSSEYDPVYSPDGRNIYFKSNKDDGYGDIWRMAIDGSGALNLMPGRSSTEDWAPAVSGDGTLLYFTSRAGGASAGDNIFRLRLSDSNITQLTSTGGAAMSWYPATQRASAPAAAAGVVYTVSPGGSAGDTLWRLLPAPAAQIVAGGADPAFAPDDSQIAFLQLAPGGNYQIYTAAANGSGPVRAVESAAAIAAASTGNNLGPFWESQLPGMTTLKGVRALSGGFLMLTNSRPASEWRAVVRAAAAARMRVVIIQTESWLSDSGGGPLVRSGVVDRSLISAVLDEASANGVGVIIGLALLESASGNMGAALNASLFGRVVDATNASIAALASNAAISTHAAFRGVYLPVEAWTPSAVGGIAELGFHRAYIVNASRAAKAAWPDKVVAISPFVSDLAIDAVDGTISTLATTTAYSAILAAAAVDIVMLQDGGGAMGLAPAELTRAVPALLGAMRAACTAAGASSSSLPTTSGAKCDVWANIESFAPGFTGGAAPWPRFLLQMAAASASATPLSGGTSAAVATVTYELGSYFFSATAAGAAALNASYASWMSWSDGLALAPPLPVLAPGYSSSSSSSLPSTPNITIAVPMYIYPCTGGAAVCDWDRLAAAGPNVINVVVFNPNSGPVAPAGTISDYAAQLTRTHAALPNASLVGYVRTAYAARSAADVKLDVDAYMSPNASVSGAIAGMVDGIFFDEASNDCADAAYYADLAAYVRSRYTASAWGRSPSAKIKGWAAGPGRGYPSGAALVLTNPGWSLPQCFANTSDIFASYESATADYLNPTVYAPPPWLRDGGRAPGDANPTRVWHIVHTASLANVTAVTRLARTYGAGILYLTDEIMPDPYSVLPSMAMWNATIAAINTANGAPPSPLPSASSTPSVSPSGGTATRTATATQTATGTATRTGSATATASATAASASATTTRSASPAGTASAMPTATRSSTPCPCSNASWCEFIRGPLPDREVIAFHAQSSTGDAWRSFDWSQITTVITFGPISAELMCYAHARGVRVAFGTDVSYTRCSASPALPACAVAPALPAFVWSPLLFSAPASLSSRWPHRISAICCRWTWPPSGRSPPRPPTSIALSPCSLPSAWTASM